ncbi:MAG: ATP-binding protein, partial [Gammaproteobacteria bacterium]|nr:ATP-binding protein [Gammaproteobacteria bacterium]
MRVTDSNELRSHKTTAELDKAVRGLMQGLPALKVKVYNLDGLTVYSSQATQIGENKSGNSGYVSALNGVVASEITWRGKFDAFEGVVSNRNVVSSYIPIIGSAGGVVAVFELYTDVTPLLGRIDEVQTQIALTAAGVLGCLYFLLVWMVWIGNGTIRSQIGIISAHKDRLAQQIEQRKMAERERNEAREQLHQSQKMEAMGTLAGGVAHDFNNILGIMNGYTRLVIGDLPKNSSQRQMLEEVVQAGERGADLVDQILAFARKDDKTRTLMRLDQSLNDSLKMLRATLPATIQLDCRIPALRAHVRADEIRIHQLVTNLVINAAHAIGSDPGTIDISCQMENVSRHGTSMTGPLLSAKGSDAITIEQRTDGRGGKLWFGILSPGDYLRLSVKDNGCGMDGSILDR